MTEISKKTNAFTFPIRIYYEDTDAGGLVYHANYIKFMERARTEWLRSIGCNQNHLALQEQTVFVIHSIDLKYLKPARFDDLLQVTVEMTEHSRLSMVFSQNIYRENIDGLQEHLITSTVKIVSVNSQSFKPKGIPKMIMEALSDH